MAKPFFKSLFKRKGRGSSHRGSKDDISQFIPSLYDPDEPHEGGFKPVQLSYEEKMCSVPSEWSLTDRAGKRFHLPRTMLFLGRDDSDFNIPSRSVDKRHAVLAYDGYEDKFRVKDLGSVNGTYVNDSRIPEQEYVTLDDMDTVRFGYDPMVYRMERIEEVPHLEHLEQQHQHHHQQHHHHQHQQQTEVKVSSPEDVSRSSPGAPPTELPYWAVREPAPPPHDHPRMGLAECEGCIVEQGIRHTCGISEESEYLVSDGRLCSSTNGHTCAPLSPPYPASYSRWEGPPHQRHSHHGHQRERVYYTSNRDHVYQPSSVVSGGQYMSPGRSYPHQDFVPQSESHPPSSSHHPQVAYQSPVYSQANNVNVIYPDQSLTQLNSYDGHGHNRPTQLPLSQAPVPHPQPEQKYQTNFQIIPPRQGQNYRVINVKFAGADQNPPKAKLDVLSPSSSGYQHINATVGHFVFKTPMDGRTETQSQSDNNANQVTRDQEYVNYCRSSSTDLSPTHTEYKGVGPEVSNGMVNATDNSSPPYKHQHSSSNSDTSPVHGGIYSPTSPRTPGSQTSPPAMRQDKRRSLHGTEPELETIKKCTPLYGQPSWWGEDDVDDDCRYPHTATLKDADRSPDGDKNNGVERPKCLSLEETEGADMSKYKSDSRYSTSHMEIPQKDTSPEKDAGHKSSSASYDKDQSAKPSPENPSPREDSGKTQELHSPPEKDESPPKTPSEKSAGPMAFTVDLGDDMFGAPKISMSDSLSQFLPHKVRKSFRSRSGSIKNPKDSGKEDSPSSGKTSRDGSPTRPGKADDTWYSGSPLYHSDGHNSALSSDNEDLSIRSDTVTTKTKQSSHSPRGNATARATRREKQERAASKTTITKTELNKQVSMTTGSVDSASYLIDKMFTHQSGRSRTQGSTVNQKTDEATEHLAHRETHTYKNTSNEGSPSKNSQSGSGGAPIGGQKTSKSTQDSKRKKAKEKSGEEGPSDNVSESGTYTIESENTGQEVQEARDSIDTVFGVDRETDTAGPDRDPSPPGLDDGREDHDKAVPTRPRLVGSDSLDVEVGSGVNEDDRPEEDEDYKIVEVLFDGVWASPKLTRRTPEVHSYQPEAVLAQTNKETPKWVSQWATLATHKTFVKSPTLSTASPIIIGLNERCDVKSSSDSTTHDLPASDRGPTLPARRVRGRGRKLPTPPVKSGSTTPLSPRSTTGPSSDVFSPRDSLVSETPERDVTSNSPDPLPPPVAPPTSLTCFINPRPDPPAVTEAMHNDVTSDVVTFVHGEMTASMESSQMGDSFHGSSYMEDEVEELPVDYHGKPLDSGRSNVSLDTEVLLRDTADVVHAMAQRVNNNHKHQEHQQKPEEERNTSSKPSAVQEEIWRRKSTELFIPLHDDDSDSEGSTFAIVNGHREMPKLKPKPKLLKSQSVDRKPPRPLHLREREKEKETLKERASVPRETKSAINSSSRTRSVVKEKHTPKVPKDATFVKKTAGSTRAITHGVPPLDLNNSFGSDIHSESETGSIMSTSTDYSESLSPKLGRRGSKGKGPMSMTRPNRAFALRRARLESEPDPVTPRSQATTPRSRPSSAGARDSPRSRPSSARDSSRSERTEVSLGAKIVQRSRESNSGPLRAKSAGPLSRTDTGRGSGRGSIRDKKPAPPPSSRKSPAPPSSRNKLERISVSNLSVSGTKSKPSSRSNSPRSEEYSAWKRRKSYDPRQAVVNAKQKAKDVRSKHTPERSLSAGPLHSRGETFSSVSSEDTSFLEDYHGYHDRGQNDSISRISSVVTHEMEAMSRSIECDDAFSGADSKLTSSLHNLLINRSNRSAFSVPRTKSLPLTLRSPPPLRNRFSAILNGRDESKAGIIQRDTKSQESYDTVMVNSIYQLSLKVRTQTDKIMEKMRERYELNGSPSPTDDPPSPTLDGEIPGYKNANQELAGILRNLRRTERHLQGIDRSLFPGKDSSASPGSPKDHQQYLRELERIRSEISGFRPIDKPVLSSSKPWRRLSRQPSQESDTTDPLASDEYY